MTTTTRRHFLQTAGAAITAAGAARLGHCPAGAETEKSKRPPNILLLFPDQHRYDWIGSTPGMQVRTPNLNALGARGVRFDRAVCASPLCAPSRACLALGMEYDRCRVPSNQENLPLDSPTFYRLLRDAGYHVMGCGKFDLNKGEHRTGLDGKYLLEEWGFSDGINSPGKWDALRMSSKTTSDPYMAFLESKGLNRVHIADFERRRRLDRGQYTATFPTPLGDEEYCDNWVAGNGFKVMAEAPPTQPWFLQVNFVGPHPPMDITARMASTSRDFDYPAPFQNDELPPEKHLEIRQNYSAMIENIDHWVGAYVERLRSREDLENTVIIYSSDHGEMLGDHNLWGKQHPQQPSIGVPLVITGPGIRSGVASDARVSVMDLAATALDFAGVEIPKEMDSRSIKPVLIGESEKHREVVYSGVKGFRTAFDGQYKLVFGDPEPGAVRLYDLLEDPWESRDVAGDKTDKVKQLREAIADDLKATI